MQMTQPNNGKFRVIAALTVVLLIVSIVIVQSQGRDKTRTAAAPVQEASRAAAFGEDCEALLVREIGLAGTEVKVAIFTFSRRNIARALRDAFGRGVKVEVKYDANSYNNMEGMAAVIDGLKKSGVACTGITMRKERAVMHHKFVIIDDRKVVTGSFNFTTTATKENYENLVVVDDAEIAKAYRREFDSIKDR